MRCASLVQSPKDRYMILVNQSTNKRNHMNYVAAVTLLLLLQYLVFMMRVGMARGSEIKAPAMTGSEDFERKSRVHLNTLEQLMIALPAMWLCAHLANPNLAAALGLIFFIGRTVYAISYIKEPSKRGIGMGIGMLAYVAMLLIASWKLIAFMIPS